MKLRYGSLANTFPFLFPTWSCSLPPVLCLSDWGGKDTFLRSWIPYYVCSVLSNDPVTLTGKRQGERGFRRMKKHRFWAVAVLSPPPCLSPGCCGHIRRYIDSSWKSVLELILAESWREVPWVCRRRVPAFQCMPRGGCFLDAGVCRNEALQSLGMMCVCLQSGGERGVQMVALAPVPSTCCPRRFLGYIIPVPEKLESLPPLLHNCGRK